MAGYDVTRYSDDGDRRCCHCRRRDSDVDSDDDRGVGACPKWRCTIQLCLLLFGIAAGIGLGILLRTVSPFDDPTNNPRVLWYLRFPGEVIVRVMSLLWAPLVVSSLISGLGSLEAVGKVSLWTLLYYLSTTILASLQGLAFVYALQPGVNSTLVVQEADTGDDSYTGVDALMDLIRNIFPDNLLETTLRHTKTESTWRTVDTSNLTSVDLREELSLMKVDGMNKLGFTVFCVIFGIAIANNSSKAKLLVDFFDAMYSTVMLVVKTMIWLYPIAIVFMLASTIVSLKDPVRHLTAIMWFLVTVSAGMATHVFVTLPILYAILVRKNPFLHMFYSLRALTTAVSTGNSHLTLPVTLDCMVSDAKVDSRVARVVCPLGGAINMDGLAIYAMVGAMFAATLRGVNPGVLEVFIMGFVVILLSVGAPPADGGRTILTVLFWSVGIPGSDALFFLPFDWLLGRFITMTNVWSDCVGAAVVHKLSRRLLSWQRPRLPETCPTFLETAQTNGSYRPITDSDPPQRKAYTLTVENESGDIVKVSKV